MGLKKWLVTTNALLKNTTYRAHKALYHIKESFSIVDSLENSVTREEQKQNNESIKK